MGISNFTDIAGSELDLTAKRRFICFVIPFCDVTGCDRMKYYNPLECPSCSVTTVGVFFTFLVLLALFIILGNVGIILVILRNRIFHNAFNMFKCSLAVADLLVGLLVVPSGAFMLLYQLSMPFDKELALLNETYTDMHGREFKRGSFCDRVHQEDDTPAGKFFSMISVLSIMASIFHLVLLSIDRFLAVRCPIKYNQGRAMNSRTATILILFVWVAGTVLSVVVPIALGTDYFSYGLSPPMIFTLKTTNGQTGMIYAGVVLGLPYVVLIGLNFITGFMILRKRTKIKRRSSNANNSNNNSRRSSEVKATITLLVMVLVFTLPTVPALIGVTFFNSVGTNSGKGSLYMHGVTYCILIPLLISNSAFNFIIYNWRNKNFRKALIELLHRTRNGKRRHFRWKKVKRAALRHSEKKRRRKMLSKMAESVASEAYKQQNSITDYSIRTITTSVRSNESMTRSNHRPLHCKASVTSSISNSSSTSYISASNLPTLKTNGEYCHSPTIPEEDDQFFAESSTENVAIQDTHKSNGTIPSKVESGAPTTVKGEKTIDQSGNYPEPPYVGNGTVNKTYDDSDETDFKII